MLEKSIHLFAIKYFILNSQSGFQIKPVAYWIGNNRLIKTENCTITFFPIGDQFTITWSKSDLRSDQDHDREYCNKVIGDQIVIADHSITLYYTTPKISSDKGQKKIFSQFFKIPTPSN